MGYPSIIDLPLTPDETFLNKMRQLVLPAIRNCVKGFSPEIQNIGESAARKFVDGHGREALITMGAMTDPTIDKVTATVVFNSANWTGKNFTGFTRPQVVVQTSEIIGTPIYRRLKVG